MEKTPVSCLHCGHRLAVMLGETGHGRRLQPHDKVRVRTDKNALGEALGWIRCPACKREQRIDASLWFHP